MIYLFDKDEKLIKIVRKSAVKTALQKYALTTERYVSDRLTVELKGLNADELEQVEYMAIQTMEDAHAFHYFYVAQKSSDELTTLIGVQSGIEELRKSPVYDKRPKNTFARDVITDLLAGTNWQARFVGETAPHSTNFYYTSVFDALKKVCVVWDLEMQFFVEMNGNRIGARYIDFKQKIGQAVGKRVVYGHNALQILQEVERTNIFTALVGRGKGEETGDGYGRKITFEDVVWSRTQGKPVDKPKGQKYLELPLMTRQYGIKNADGSMRPKIGFVDFSEEENPEVLIERTYRALIDAARPQLTLKTSSVYLRGVKVGDTIRVVRHDKKLDYDTRIFEITFNRLNNQSSDIKLGDRIGESNEAKAQTIADKAVEQFVNNEFSNFVQNLPDYLPSADGFNNNWYGAEDPTVKYPGKVLINDIWYKPDPEHEGHKIMLRWTGEVWEEILRTYESEALRDRIAEEIAQVNQSMQAQSEEHDRQVADILSKTQSVESLANQAKADAASAITQALLSKDEAIADAGAQVATVSQALNTAKTELQTAIASVDQKARDSQASATTLRNDLNLQASKILAQAQAQTALTNRVTTVESLADGTKTTVAELSKTVNKATGDIASVTSRTKSVEDTLSQTRTQYETLTQTINTQTGQIDSINRKTADLQSGIDGVRERFENLRVGARNYAEDYDFNRGMWEYSQGDASVKNIDFTNGIYTVTTSTNTRHQLQIHSESGSRLGGKLDSTALLDLEVGETYTLSVEVKANSGSPKFWLELRDNGIANYNAVVTHLGGSGTAITATSEWVRYSVTGTIKPNSDFSHRRIILGYNEIGSISFRKVELSRGTKPMDTGPAIEDTEGRVETLRSELGTYIRNATENSAELVKRIETADGKAVDAKSYAQQTAEGFKSRIESLETYKNEEGIRASQYLTASRTETAKQLTAERTAIANNYVAKSIYDENVRGTTLKLNEIKTTADTAKQNLATYQETVDRKLTELTSSTQTLDGKINTASAKVDTVAGQIRTELTRVEGKIPSDLGGRNYILKSDVYSTSGSRYFDTSPEFIDYAYSGKYVTISLDIKGENLVPDSRGLSRIGCELRLNLSDGKVLYLQCQKIVSGTQPRERISVTRKIPEGVSVVSANKVNMYVQVGGTALAGRPKFELSSIPTDWSPAPEDINSELSSTKTLITQTAEGQTQLSNRLTTTQDKVSTAETKINQLIGDVSSKVSQTDYNTLTGRMASAETAITQNAQEISRRLTSTQVEQAINAKGFATTTVVENKVRETSESFSRTISETKALIPTEVSGNLLLESNVGWSNAHDKAYKLADKLEKGKTYTLVAHYWHGEGATALTSTVGDGAWNRLTYNPTIDSWMVTFRAKADIPSGWSVYLASHPETALGSATFVTLVKGNIPLSRWEPAYSELATVTALHNVTDTVDSHTRTIGAVGTNGSILDNISKVTQTAAGLVQEVSGTNGLKTQVGQLKNSWAVKISGPEGLKTAINASTDGVRLKGKNLWLDGNTLIDNAVITSAMIAGLDAGKITTGYLDAARIRVGAIDGSKIAFDEAFFNGLTANQAYLKKLFAKDAFITSVQAVSLSASQIASGIIKATNGAMVIDLDNALTEYKERATIRFHSAGNVLYREKRHPRGHNTIGALMFKDSNGGGVMTAVGNTSHQTIDTMRNNYGEGGLTGSFAGIRVVRDDADTQRDRVDIIADRIIMAHSTNFQEPTNSGFYFYPTAVRGWWNLGAILQHISNKFKEHGWGEIGDIYHLGYAGETTPSQYT